ncbi:hypothetical protein EKL29_21160 [Pantoea sp. YU22]|uniref:hypothetical protein n=1 Tax=Pantoea sp. YU22 TaxID=2497684 RepID=UPI000F8868E6|nr:hypothetical protein [Pantoea sp. YU22]RTY53631.1 hypothetical protein EKL29_21160 [Pantoea sp. YU22]
MHRIDTAYAQADKFGTGKNGFTNGDTTTGRRATQLDADYFDSIQEEISSVIEAAGIPLDKSKMNQLLTALNQLYLHSDNAKVAGALQKANNLQDLTNADVARQALRIDKVQNWMSVQANGGKHSSGNHQYYLDWGTDGKLHVTVDNTDVGELFTTNNPPNASQVGAMSLNGGVFNDEASISVRSAVRNPNVGDILYSPLFRAVLTGRGGDMDFKDGASAVMRVVEEVGTIAYLQLLWDGFGSVHSFRFTQNGDIRCDGDLYAGQAIFDRNGNAKGAAWDGGYLSDWLHGQFADVRNSIVNVNNTASDAWNKANDAQVNRVTDIRLTSEHQYGASGVYTYTGSNTVLTGFTNRDGDYSAEGLYWSYIQYYRSGQWITVGVS